MQRVELIEIDPPEPEHQFVDLWVHPVDDPVAAMAPRFAVLDFGLYRMPIRPHAAVMIVQRH